MFRAFAYLLPGIAFIGWITFQMLAKKKKLRDLLNEALFIVFFLTIWFVIYYWAFH